MTTVDQCRDRRPSLVFALKVMSVLSVLYCTVLYCTVLYCTVLYVLYLEGMWDWALTTLFSIMILSIWSWNCLASASTVFFSPSFRA